MVIDDDAGIKMLVSQVLKKGGYEVMAADNGAEGLALISQHKPVLIVNDIQMPQMDGFEVLEKVCADPELCATPVTLLTSLTERVHFR